MHIFILTLTLDIFDPLPQLAAEWSSTVSSSTSFNEFIRQSFIYEANSRKINNRVPADIHNNRHSCSIDLLYRVLT